MPVAKAERSREFLARIRRSLGEKRVMHSVFVAEYFSSFAERAGLDHDEAVAAGLLHDLARGMEKEELLAEARARRIPMGEAQLAKPLLLHGPVAEVQKVLGARAVGVGDCGRRCRAAGCQPAVRQSAQGLGQREGDQKGRARQPA